MSTISPPASPSKSSTSSGRPRKMSAPAKLRKNSVASPVAIPTRSRQPSTSAASLQTPPSPSSPTKNSSTAAPVSPDGSPRKKPVIGVGIKEVVPIIKKPVLPTPKPQNIASPSRQKAARPTSATALPPIKTTNTALDRRGSTSLASITAPGAIVTGGLIGCAAGAAILMAIGIYYDYAGVKAAIATAKAARLAVDNLTDELVDSLKSGTYSVEEALKILRQTTLTYAQTVPEGQPLINRIFDEIETVRVTRGAEVERALGDAYEELHIASNEGYGASEMRSVLWKHTGRLATFAGRAIEDVLARNPALKVAAAKGTVPRIGGQVWREKKVAVPAVQGMVLTA